MRKTISVISPTLNFDETINEFLKRINVNISYYRSTNAILAYVKKVLPSLIIIDRDLNGMTGDEVCYAIKNANDYSKIPIIIVLEEEKGEILERCLLSGCDDYLHKPLNNSEMEKKIGRFLNVHYRKELRILFRSWLKGRTLSSFFFGNSEDISFSGMLFTSDANLSMGDVIEITFFLPASTTKIAMTCKVVRMEAMEGESADTKYGVQFLEMDEQAKLYLQDYLEKLKSKKSN